MNEKKCLEFRGHCWVRENSLDRTTIGGEIFVIKYRECKHCKIRQKGFPQEAIKWENVKGGVVNEEN